MKSRLYAATSLLVLGGLSSAAQADSTVVVKTKGGLSVSTADKAYSMKVGGRIQMDYNNYDGVMNADQNGESGSDFFLRRSRVALSGVIASDWAYKLEYNVNEGGGGDITDAYIRYQGWGKKLVVTMGNQREPFGFENLTSSKNITGIERSAASNAFDVGRSIGVALSGSGSNWSYAAGVYEEGKTDDQIEHSYAARFTYAPINESGKLLHLGTGMRVFEGETGTIKARPGIRDVDSSDRISSGISDAAKLTLNNLELAAVFNSFHASSEYFAASADSASVGDMDVDGYYLTLGWFLTGESRSYKTSAGAFDKVSPAGDKGAWEVFVRVGELNLEDHNVGNNASVSTVGVNWYASSLVRAGLNVVNTSYDKAINNEDEGMGIAARVQLLF